MKFRTRAIHVGNEPEEQTGAVVRPIHMAATFVQPGSGDWGEYDYSRSGNPTRKAFETTLASLEAGHAALAFSSNSHAPRRAMAMSPAPTALASTSPSVAVHARPIHTRLPLTVPVVEKVGEPAAVANSIAG